MRLTVFAQKGLIIIIIIIITIMINDNRKVKGFSRMSRFLSLQRRIHLLLSLSLSTVHLFGCFTVDTPIAK